MERLGNGQQTLARNGDGSVAIDVREPSEVVLLPRHIVEGSATTGANEVAGKGKRIAKVCKRQTRNRIMYSPEGFGVNEQR